MEVDTISTARKLAAISLASLISICGVCTFSTVAYGDTNDATVAEKYINMEEAPKAKQAQKIAEIVDVKISEDTAIRVGLTEGYLNVNYTSLETDAELSVVEHTESDSLDIQSIVNNLKKAEAEIAKEEAEKARKAEEARRAEEARKAEEERKAKAKAALANRNYTVSRNQGGLLDINNPDPNYRGRVVNVTGSDRDILERLVMGESGNQGFEGAALVAQCIRDTYVLGGYTSINKLRSDLKYSGGLNRKPNQDVLDAVAYIFDEGGYAVKHRILYFYAPKMVYSRWHESQLNVITYKDHKFFDRKW